MTRTITTTISDEFHQKAQKLNIRWSEALRIGLAVLFMERGADGYLNDLNTERIKSLARKAGFEAKTNA